MTTRKLYPPHGGRTTDAEPLATGFGLGKDTLGAVQILQARRRSRVGVGASRRENRAGVRDDPLADVSGDEVRVADIGKQTPRSARENVI